MNKLYSMAHYCPNFSLKITKIKQIKSISLSALCFSLFISFGLVSYGQDKKADTSRKLTDTIQLQEVIVSTGYQQIPKERATGSFSFVDSALFNRRISTNVLDHIENMTTGVLFDRTENAPDALLIRGRSTIYANAAPLIVVDNFPYDGGISNLNPNDVSSVTVLKDAAAASIWGARAGNGVIVITTKRGKSSTPRISISSSTNFTPRPDLYSQSIISSEDYIELEKTLFAKGYYNSALNNTRTRPPLTPVVEILAKRRAGTLTEAQANALIDPMKAVDARDDLSRYFYRMGISQQHALNVSGRNERHEYYLSAGYDNNRQTLVGNTDRRISLRSNNTFHVIPRLDLDANLLFTRNQTRNGENNGYDTDNGFGLGLYPYADLVDASGHGLNVVRDFRSTYTDTAGHGLLPSWKYNPYEEITNNHNNQTDRDYLLQTAIRYRLASWLNASVQYQYENMLGTDQQINEASSYTARNLINRFYQPGAANPFPVPLGGILTTSQVEGISHQGRAQLNLDKNWHKHQLTAIVGWEIREMRTLVQNNELLGYQRDGNLISTIIDYSTQFAQFNNPSTKARINNGQSISEKLDRFISTYANVAYTYDQRYVLSGSIRKDEANLFGLATNQKGVPLWSVGGSWHADKEAFYTKQLPLLTLRLTYGHSGNIARNVSALTTAQLVQSDLTPATSAQIINPPNERLRWEQVRMLNTGFDLQSRDHRWVLTLDYYRKKSIDLMGVAPANPTLGTLSGAGESTFQGNVASMKGSGFELNAQGRIIQGAFNWNMNLLLSRSVNEVTKYLLPASNLGNVYLSAGRINPVQGKPLFALYSFPWMGLDPENGNPMGYYQGAASSDWNTIYGQTLLDSMLYNGPVQPTVFGSFRNTFCYRGFSLSANISFKAGYYFRRSSVNYGNLFSGWTGHADYALRWQQPGNEQHTQIPSLLYPNVGNRDAFYTNAAILVERGDQLRLEDIQLSYRFDRAALRRLPLQELSLALYTSNLGLLWTSNAHHVDPNNQNSPIPGRSLSLSIQANF